MMTAFRRLGGFVFRFFFPDARTPLQRVEILLSCLVFVVMAAMWVAAVQSGKLTDAPVFGSK